MGAGTDVIKIRGVDYLRGTTYSVIPDQIEAGTFMVAAAATGGDVLVKNVIPKHLESITNKLEKIGVNIEEFDDSVRVWVDGPLVKTNIKTMPHPWISYRYAAADGYIAYSCRGVLVLLQKVSGNSVSVMLTNSEEWAPIFQ